MRHYDHRVHAGNAGDVWKHFLLLETANYLLIPDCGLIYAESHAGRPGYALRTPGDWEGGIGRCWMHLPTLKRENFCYFAILSNANPSGLERYPGSAALVLQAARRRGSSLFAELWDIDPAMEAAWNGCSSAVFHQGDGFSGVLSLLDRSPPRGAGLLLIDPPFMDAAVMQRAADLLCRAEEKGWVALCWYPTGVRDARDEGMEGVARGEGWERGEGAEGGEREDGKEKSAGTLSDCGFEEHSLSFARAGLDGGRFEGAAVALAGADCTLSAHLRSRKRQFIRAMNPPRPRKGEHEFDHEAE